MKNKNFFVGLKARGGRDGDTRLGIVITKKIYPRAVDRNRLRRAVRESARTILTVGQILMSWLKLGVLSLRLLKKTPCAV